MQDCCEALVAGHPIELSQFPRRPGGGGAKLPIGRHAKRNVLVAGPHCRELQGTSGNVILAGQSGYIRKLSRQITVMHPSNHKKPQAEGNSAQAATSNHKRRATPLKQPQATTSGVQLRSRTHKQPQAEGNSAQACTNNHKRRATPLKHSQTTTSGGQLRSIIKQPQTTLRCFTSKLRATPLNDTRKRETASLGSSNARVAIFEMAVAFAKQAMLFVSMSTTWHDHTTPLKNNKHSGD
jgi:hypothetical protein